MANSKKPPFGASRPVAAAQAPVPSAAPKAVVPAPVPAPVAKPAVSQAAPALAPAVKPVEAKPEIKSESKPVETKAASAKPAETKPVETKAVEAKPVVPAAATPVLAAKAAPVPVPAPVAAPKPAPAVEAHKTAPVAAKPAAAAPKTEKPVPAPKPAIKTKPAAPALDVLKPVTVLQENVRASTEKAITVFRGQYAEVKTFAETATIKLEDSVKAAQEGSRALGFKFFEIAKAQTQAHLDHTKTLAAAKTLPELLSAQQKFLVAQIERAQAGSKDVTTLATQVANDVAAPLQASLNMLLRRG